MASAKHIFGEFEENKNVPGEEEYVLKLDANEVEAVCHYLYFSGADKLKERRERSATGEIPSTSLAAASVRVYDALDKIRNR
jgi:hypothetical protein